MTKRVAWMKAGGRNPGKMTGSGSRIPLRSIQATALRQESEI